MRAMTLHAYGGALTLNEVPPPAVTDTRILVRGAQLRTVNHLDLVEGVRRAPQGCSRIRLPWVPGHEFSRVVAEVGKDVRGFVAGDAVFGNSDSGAYADYLVVDRDRVAAKPAKLSFDEAASVPVAAQTAWQGIFTHGRLVKGQSILIHGGAGAVGAYAVQFAARAGANVIVTASRDDGAFLRSLGAHHVIDYRTARFEDEAHPQGGCRLRLGRRGDSRSALSPPR